MNIIKVVIPNKAELLRVYMPYLKNGGIFIRESIDYEMYEEVFLLISLLDSKETLAVNGAVCWQSPKSAVGYPVGIGVHFKADKAGVEAKSKLEVLLGASLKNQQNSYTF